MENTIIVHQHNYNLATAVYSEYVSHKYIGLKESFTTCICDDLDNVQLKLIQHKKDETILPVDSQFTIYDNILNCSYIKHIDLNQEKNYILYNHKFVPYNDKELFINSKNDIHLQFIKKIDLSMKFNTLYDIIIKNNRKYIFSIQLTHLCYSKIKNNSKFNYNDDTSSDSDNDNQPIIYKLMDLLLYTFDTKFKNSFNALIRNLIGKNSKFDKQIPIVDLVENDTYIHGIYKCNLTDYNEDYNKHIQSISNVNFTIYTHLISNLIYKYTKNTIIDEETNKFLDKYRISDVQRKCFNKYKDDMDNFRKNAMNSKLSVSFEEFMNIVLKYDKQSRFVKYDILTKKKSYKYLTNKNRYEFILSEQYNNQPKQALDDNLLFELFKPKHKPVKVKKFKPTIEPIIEPHIEPHIEPTNVNIIEPTPLLKLYILNIEYVYNVEQDKIIENHLHYIVNYLDRFTKLYEKYKSILVIKSYDKSYTKYNYFNFRFGRDKYASKCFHVYLTDNLSDIVNITYIESIELA